MQSGEHSVQEENYNINEHKRDTAKRQGAGGLREDELEEHVAETRLFDPPSPEYGVETRRNQTSIREDGRDIGITKTSKAVVGKRGVGNSSLGGTSTGGKVGGAITRSRWPFLNMI